MSKMDEHVAALLDYALARPGGFTRSDAMTDLDLPHTTFKNAMTALRHFLGHGSSAIPAVPVGNNEEWVYRLTGKFDANTQWAKNRIKDARTRLKTMTATLESVVNATDPATTDGKIARAMHLDLRQLTERIEMIQETSSL